MTDFDALARADAAEAALERETKLRIKLTTLVGETQAERDRLRAGITALGHDFRYHKGLSVDPLWVADLIDALLAPTPTTRGDHD